MTPDDLRQRLSDEVLRRAYDEGVKAAMSAPLDTYREARHEAMREVILAALAAPAPVRTCAGCASLKRRADSLSPDGIRYQDYCRTWEAPVPRDRAQIGCSLWQPTPQEEA
jgi:hypothetical protein